MTVKLPWTLSWADVDPGTHPFDPGRIADLVAETASRPPDPDPAVGGGRSWTAAVSEVLVAHFGDWAAGWCWSPGESDLDGGPVSAWCCVAHSVTTPEATAAAVADALVDWRVWIEDLAERFARIPLPADPDTWTPALADLIEAVAARTGAESDWFRHCEQVLDWFLERAGIREVQRGTLIDAAVGEEFQSWRPPGPETAARVAGRLAAAVL